MTEKEIIAAISDLASAGNWPVYLVGGYLRDRILHRACHDLDFVVEGDAIIFARKVAKSLSLKPPVFYSRFGTAMFKSGKTTLEFATCRKESYLAHSRKPKIVASELKDDLKRRDFTINALALSLKDGKMVDLFAGREDIKAQILRTPIDPDKTFFDDPLRMLRAVRFASRLNFVIHPQTEAAIIRNRERLKIVSRERIADEFLRTMETTQPVTGIVLLDHLQLLPLVLPEIENLKNVVAADDRICKDVFRHTLIVLDRVSRRTKDPATRLAALFHDVGKPSTQKFIPGEGWTFHDHPIKGARIWLEVARRFNIGSPVREKVYKLIELHLRPHYLAGAGVNEEGASNRAINHLVNDGGKYLKSLFILSAADLTSKNTEKVRKGLSGIADLEKNVRQWKKEQRAAIFKLAIDGNEIMKLLEIKASPLVGKVKSELEGLVLDGEIPNRKRDLKKYLQDKKAQLVLLK
ncbi:MAG: HD domain-containing protein [Candidatus Omnitrophica bacterium]|nr:HD domain-containing protein [Candidatus Omnitrophota bacterium]